MSNIDENKVAISISMGMTGYFAFMHDNFAPFEPIQSGIGRYRNRDDAVRDAVRWAAADEVALSPETHARAFELGLLADAKDLQPAAARHRSRGPRR